VKNASANFFTLKNLALRLFLPVFTMIVPSACAISPPYREDAFLDGLQRLAKQDTPIAVNDVLDALGLDLRDYELTSRSDSSLLKAKGEQAIRQMEIPNIKPFPYPLKEEPFDVQTVTVSISAAHCVPGSKIQALKPDSRVIPMFGPPSPHAPWGTKGPFYGYTFFLIAKSEVMRSNIKIDDWCATHIDLQKTFIRR